jgi:thioredoxin reductase (NADPH)
MNIYNQLTKLGVKILNKKITSIDLNNKIINNNIKYEYLVIATGRKSRMLSLEHEKELLGKGISTCALCDGFFYTDKKVAIVGGGSSSLTEALYLSKICKEVIIIHRRDKLTADKYLIDKVNSTKNIKVLYNSNITKYNQNNNKLTSVTINNKDNLEVEGVFLAIGSTPNSEIFNVNKDNNYIIVDSNYMANIDKVYAIGDVIKKDYYQLSTAASDAVVAASNIIKRENKNS